MIHGKQLSRQSGMAQRPQDIHSRQDSPALQSLRHSPERPSAQEASRQAGSRYSMPGLQPGGSSGQIPPNRSVQERFSPSRAWLSESMLTRVVAAICFLVFAWVAWISRLLPPPFNPADVGPGEVPLLAAAGGMICSVILYVQGFRAGSNRIEIGRPASVAAGMLIILAYVLSMPHVGFYISSIVAIPLLMLVGGEHKPLPLALGSAGFVLFVYLCFQLVLDVQFP